MRRHSPGVLINLDLIDIGVESHMTGGGKEIAILDVHQREYTLFGIQVLVFQGDA
jgi:hypothetical protein